MKKELLRVENLIMHFKNERGRVVKAVDGVSFSLYEGETFGLVGESASGKSTTGRTIIGLCDATEGEIYYQGKPVRHLPKKERAKKMQMIFQDPYASLNPRMKVADIIAEGIDIHKLAKNKEERKKRVYELLELVGLKKEHAFRYPHEFSGGQRQRIGIARALAVEPELIIADEPTAALDVSIQAQIVNLLKDLQQKKNMTMLFISHNLAVVKYISDRIGVMYKGRLVEVAPTDELYNHPLHPYTQSLLSCLPEPDPHSEQNKASFFIGEINEIPDLKEVHPGHWAAL